MKLENYHQLVSQLQEEKKRLYKNSFVPNHELTQLVYIAYACSEISIDKACEMLRTDIVSFRNEWNQWIKTKPVLEDLFNGDLVKQKWG